MADYNTMSTDELLALCDEQNIPTPADSTQVNKQDLIRRLNLGADAVRAEEQNTHVTQTLRQPGELTPAEQEAAAQAGPATVEAGGDNLSYSERDAAAAPADDGYDRGGNRYGKTTSTPSGQLGSAAASLGALSRGEIEQLGLMIDKIRAAGGIEAGASTPRVSLQQQGQHFPIDVAHTSRLKIGAVLEALTAAGHQVDPRMIPRRGWVVRRAEGFEDGFHDGRAFLSVATNDGRNLYAEIPGLADDDYTNYQAEKEAKKHAGIAAAFRQHVDATASHSAAR